MAEGAQSRGEFIDYYTKTKDYCAHWQELGLLLSVPRTVLNIIEADNPKHTVECHMNMLDVWLTSDPKNPEEQLDIALRKLKNKYSNGEKYKA